MDIKNLADLAKIAALCRKKGIESLKIGPDGIELRMGSEPAQLRIRKGLRPLQDSKDELSNAEPSEEDLLFWSSAGLPDGDPKGTN